MVTITPSLRETPYAPVSPTTDFPVGFPIFGKNVGEFPATDLEVVVNGSVRTDFTVIASFNEGISTDAVVRMNSGVVGAVIVRGNRTPRRTDQYANGAPLRIPDHNYSLNRVEAEIQEVRRDTDRSTSGLKQEIADRIAADNAEREARLAADQNLNGRVDQEIIDRQNGDKALASLIGQAGEVEVPIYDTRVAVTFANIKSTIKAIRTSGYAVPGDGGAALYKRVASEPAHIGKVQSADGAWWELAETKPNAAMLGATASGEISNELASGVVAFNIFEVPSGTFKNSASVVIDAVAKKTLRAEPRTSRIYNDDPDTARNLINFYSSSNIHVSGLDIDQNKKLGSQKGHAFVLRDTSYATVADMVVTGIGGEGTGVISYGTETSPGAGTYNKTRNVFYRDIHVKGNRDIEVNTNGAIIVDSLWSGMRGIHARNIGQFPAEFKNDCRYGYLSDVLIENCRTGLYHGSVSADHPSYIASSNVVVQGADFGVFSGLGTYNAYSNIIVDFSGTSYPAPEALRHSGSRSSVFGLLTAGTTANARGVSYRSSAENNYTKINAQHESACVVQIEPGARRNVTEVAHAWNRSSLLNTNVVVGLNNVFGASTGDNNPIYSHALGEYLGNLSGSFKWYDSIPSATPQSSDLWRYGSSGKNSRLTLLGDDGYAHGFGVATPSGRGDMIFNQSQGRWQITTGGLTYYLQSNSLYAGPDNTINLGTTSNRWATVYAGTGTINTSDAREKDWRGGLNEAEINVAKRLSKLIGIYKWKDAITQKGEDARLHAGVQAQDVITAFEAEGLDPFRYGVVCYDEWQETPEVKSPVHDENGNETGEFEITEPYQAAGNRYGVRYDELWAFVAAGFEARLSTLEL